MFYRVPNTLLGIFIWVSNHDFVSAHTQDNSFLGFVIGSNENLKDIDVTKKKPKALIYAKRASYLQVILILLFNTTLFLEP